MWGGSPHFRQDMKRQCGQLNIISVSGSIAWNSQFGHLLLLGLGEYDIIIGVLFIDGYIGVGDGG